MVQAIAMSGAEHRHAGAAAAGCGCATCRRQLELEALIGSDPGNGLDQFLPALIKRDISGSVGRGGRNRAEDVRSVQVLLNTFVLAQRLTRRTPLDVDGRIGPATIGAIEDFQRKFVGMRNPDGRVDPGGRTLGRLNGSVLQPPASAGGDGGTPLPPATAGGYAVIPGQAYGSKWRDSRPPGLPTTARQASGPGAALPAIRQAARSHALGDAFVAIVSHLAETESGARYALPANTFNAAPPEHRPKGKRLITAWGVFQFNRDAWRALPGVPKTAFPWDASQAAEVERPVARYAAIFRAIKDAGGDDLAAARGVRLWHRSPSVAYARYLSAGRRQGFVAAWSQVPANHRSPVDSRMRQIGLLAAPSGGNELEIAASLPEGRIARLPCREGCKCRRCHRQRQLEAIIDAKVGEAELERFLPVLVTRQIARSVGAGGKNDAADVRAVQELLNTFILARRLPGRAILAVDGKIGTNTINAIKDFQRLFVGMRSPDGRVDPGGRTLEKLNGSVLQPAASSGAAPTGGQSAACSVNGAVTRCGTCLAQERRLHAAPRPSLVTVPAALQRGRPSGRQLDARAATAYGSMVEAGRGDGIAAPYLQLMSGHRDYDRQAGLWRGRLIAKFRAAGCGADLACIGRAIDATTEGLRDRPRPHGRTEWLSRFLMELEQRRCGQSCNPAALVASLRKGTAPPGRSPHHTGRAVDIYVGNASGYSPVSTKTANVNVQRRTAAFRWLVCNAARFGFHPLRNEPWHWEYNP